MPEISLIPVGFEDRRNTRPVHTPWGEADTIETLAEGVIQVSTSTHGGIGVDSEVANKRLSAPARAEAIRQGGRLWFEEDCDWAIVCNEMPELFSERHRELAVESLKRWNQTYLDKK